MTLTSLVNILVPVGLVFIMVVVGSQLTLADLRRAVRARYNAPAKPIERWFGDFESRYLSTLPGWIAGNCMNKRQEAIGRTVAPYGTFEVIGTAGRIVGHFYIHNGAKGSETA